MFLDDRRQFCPIKSRRLGLGRIPNSEVGFLATVHLQLHHSELVEKKTQIGSKEDFLELVLAVIEKRQTKVQTLGKCRKQV